MNHDSTNWRPSDLEQTTQPAPPRRTNSLALEKSDCYTCSQKNRKCDRKRRQCETCEQLNDTCTGYPVRLQWQNSKMQSTPVGSKPAAAPTVAPAQVSVAPPEEETRAAGAGSTSHPPTRTFKFVGNKPRKPRKSRKAKLLEERDRAAREEQAQSEQRDMEQAVLPVQSQGVPHASNPANGSHSTNQGLLEDGQYDSIVMPDGGQQLMGMRDPTANYDAQYQMNWEMLDMPLSNNFNFMSLPNELLDIPNFVISPTDHGALLFDLEAFQHPMPTSRQREEQNGASHRRTDSASDGRRSSAVHSHDQSFLDGVAAKSTSSQSPQEVTKPHIPPISMTQDRCSILLNMCKCFIVIIEYYEELINASRRSRILRVPAHWGL